MAPRLQMRIAVVMMFLGVCPFLLALVWALNSLSYERHHHGAAAGPAGSLGSAVLLGAYGFALVVAGGGTLLSYWAVKRSAERVTGLGTVRTIVAVALALPLFLYGALHLPSL